MDDQYDQFGNYIGPEIGSDSQQDNNSSQQQENQQPNQQQQTTIVNQHRIILHQDKKYYPTHQQMYPQAQTLIQQEDAQSLQTPIVAMKQQKFLDLVEQLTPSYSYEFFKSIMNHPKSIRNVSIVGHLHHGKSLLMDMLIQETHPYKNWNLQKNYRWLDTRVDEQQRLISIKSTPMSLLLNDLKSKTYLINFIDTPGHPNFVGQLSCALRVSDGVVLVVDVIQGLMMMTQRAIKLAIKQQLPIIVFINKIDRLILQLKIPPEDAYLKIKHTLEEINGVIQNTCASYNLDKQKYIISPLLNNVIFGSSEYSFLFTLKSFTQLYSNKFKSADPSKLSKVLWGDYFFDRNTNKFVKKVGKQSKKRTFVQFVIEPIYKIFSHAVGKDKEQLQPFLARLGVFLKNQQYRLNIKSLVKLIFQRYFHDSKPLIDTIVEHIPSPDIGTKKIMELNYTGQHNQLYHSISKCDPTGPLFINITKNYNKKNCKSFDVFGRVLSGTIKVGDMVRIMGENYTTEEQEDVFVKPVVKLYILQGRFRLQVESVSAGNYVLIQGIDQAVGKTATIVSAKQSLLQIMRPIKFWTTPVIKIAIQPLVPSELPKLLQSLRKVNKSYPLLKTKVQESGEHIIIGTGELQLDSILHDVRQMYSDIEVKISDPSVCFSQTVIDTSGIKCYADTPNKKNRITTLASPLEKGLVDMIQKQTISLNRVDQMKYVLQNQYEWDILASNNVWAFGPDVQGGNILINDSFPTNTNQKTLDSIKGSLIQGFRWSARQGPLCDQPMRNVKFRIIQAELSKSLQDLSAGQMIPTSRRAYYSAFLTANPRMMEPFFFTEIQCTNQSLNAIYAVIGKRRGNVVSQIAKAGSPLYTIKAHIPAIDSFGFQTDLRVHTTGQAFCLTIFDHWNMLPGDPLDKNIVLRPLEVLQPHQLARQFMIKTRRRKGLNEQVSIVKYFDDLNVKEILKSDTTYKDFV